MKLRRLLVQIHLYVGLAAGLLVSLTGITGSLLVFSHELDARLYPQLLHTHHASAAGPQVTSAAAWSAVASAYPHVQVQSILPPREAGATYELRLKGERRAYVDPYTGTVLGLRTSTDHPLGLLFSLHTALLNGESGKNVVGAGGLLLLVLGATGVILWWPGKRRARQGFTVQWGASWKRVILDLHRVTGASAVLLLSLMALTGATMVWGTQVTAWMSALTSAPPRPRLVSTPPSGAKALPLEELIARAEAALPGAEITRITPGSKRTAPVVIRMKFAQELHPNGTSFVHLDQYSGGVLLVEDARRASIGPRLLNLRYPLHIGWYGGLPVRILYALVGLTPAFLFLTGCLAWWNRVGASKKSRLNQREGQGRSDVRPPHPSDRNGG